MTSPENSASITRAEYQGIGVSEENVGLILQRGSEELRVEKLPNLFTVRLSNDQQTYIDPKNSIEEITRGPIPMAYVLSIPAGLEEIEVEPDQLDAAMEFVRQSDRVVFASHVYRVDNDPGMVFFLSDQITIQFDESVGEASRNQIASDVGLEYVKPVDGIDNAFVYRVISGARENPIKISNHLKWNPEVLIAEPNIVVRSQPYYRPTDPLYPKQWYLHHNGGSSQLAANSHVSAEQAWDITRGVRSVIVAITDDSVDLNHPDFQGPGKIVAPIDLKGRDSLPMPEAASDNHGTACAGVAVAEENGFGVVGVAPGCALMPVRTTGYLDDESVEQIFNWAIQKGASIISCSWGASAIHFPLSLRQSAVITKAAKQGRQGKGCIVIFAAGNANRPINGVLNEQGWPNNVIQGQVKWLAGFAVHPDVITVSACTSLSQKSAYSNWGTGISVCAPSNNAPPGMWLPETGYIGTPPTIRTALSGLGVFTTDRVGGAGYDQSDFTPYFGGTSSATPVVAGVAALILSVNPDLSALEVRRILEQTTDK
ncbi:MAG: S8 family serine peptidase, partial [Cyanobacteriota bacterium]|nr:S8 family serine peptidase [Cyanobacteriota bacterium]